MKFHFYLKQTLFLLAFGIVGHICFSQKTLPADQWAKVDSFVKKGLTKSALEEVNKIYIKAKKTDNNVQLIKALIYKLTLQENIIENSTQKNIDSLQIEIAEVKEPAKSILESITAEMYWNFFQQHRYQLYQRTNTVNFQKDDINTWTTDDLHARISALFLASLKEEKLLQQTKLEPFDAIISKGNVRYLRPTLYDLLAHRALDYFKNDERNISRPSYAFEIKDENSFDPAEKFIQHSFTTNDSNSLHHKALLIFQELLRLHLHDSKPDALIDADLERIAFVQQFGVMQNKDSLYLQALKTIYENYPASPAAAQASYLMAQFIYGESKKEGTVPDSSAYSVSKAKAILDEVVRKFPDSEGGINAKNLLTQILHPILGLTTEKVNVPGLPFRTLVKYKNFNTLYLRILTLTPKLKAYFEENRGSDELFQRLVKEETGNSWFQPLPPSEDYMEHSVEVKIDDLKSGEYVLLASAGKDFSLNKNPLAAQKFYVSNISFIQHGQEFFILDRTTGQPLAGAKVQPFKQEYDYNTSGDRFTPLPIQFANKNGFLKISVEDEKDYNSRLRLDISFANDRLNMDDLRTNYYYYSGDATDDYDYKTQREFDEDNAKVFLFTDRSIYRPGQLVYFKGIGVTKEWKSNMPVLLANKDSISVILMDANRQQVDSIKVILNEFGSFNGRFRLPENKLNGAFEIDVFEYENSSVSFSVEEYKRPKFYTEFDTLKRTYRVNDTVTITGHAKAYAGNNISGASVSYRVTRIARFLYPWMFWRKGFPQVQPMEITYGEITTDADGNFFIRFAAIPDLQVDKKTDPVFDYKVEADVTDLNGETRSGEITVPVGYKALELQVKLSQGDIVDIDSLKRIIVTSKNLSGQPETVKAEVKVYKLQPPKRLIRERLWEEPDQFILDKNEFIQLFPHDEYKDETKKETWQRSEVVFELNDSTNSSKFSIRSPSDKSKNLKFRQGWYVIEANAKDRYGQEVKDVKYFQVYDSRSDTLPGPGYLWNVAEKNIVQPGEIAKLLTGTSAENVFLIEEINKQKFEGNNSKSSLDNNDKFNFLKLNENKKTFDFDITEEDRGGFGVNYFFVKDNRFYMASNTVYVPWSNKVLNISFNTYRDKTLPGSEEKWKVKISGSKGQKVAAEMLAAMYDASLDQFKPHAWHAIDVWPLYKSKSAWQGLQNFATVQSVEKYWNERYIQPKEKNYDVLIFQKNYNVMIRGARNVSNEMREISAPSVALQGKVAGIDVRESRLDAVVATAMGIKNKSDSNVDGQMDLEKKEEIKPLDQSQIQIRKNFNEAAFFFPELRTDKDGSIEFSFTMPEALTQWKLMTLAHTKDLASGYATKTVITQKELMVQPNAPRFLREGDQMKFSARITNLSDKILHGNAELHLLNATTMNPVDSWFKNISGIKTFTVAAGQGSLVTFTIEVPKNFNEAVVYRIIAKAGEISDGEEAAIPVVTNRALVTETMPLPMRGTGTKDFKFDKLIASGNSSTLSNYALTVEYTTNPAWYAVQSLPYLMEYPYECAEQTFNRYYANALAKKIVDASPKIKAIFEKWKTIDTAALQSNLQKNEELKSVLLEETPWVLQAQSEEQQKKNIALLFDAVKMSMQLESSLTKLADMQSPNGGFVWFKGGRDDRYMTQYIVTGIGHLKKLNALPAFQESALQNILKRAIPYLDNKIKDDYDQLIKYKADLTQNNLSAISIQYLYMRSFFPEDAIAASSKIAYNYYREQAQKYWLKQSIYMQAMIALSLNRTKDAATPNAIIRSLKENSINNEELGMYWKEWDQHGYWWYQAPIESQAMMIEAFSEIEKDQKTIDDLKTWLLKNKQTNNWKTTKATADACYALLLQGTDWLSEEKTVTIKLGNTSINNKSEKQQAGTGYFKRKIGGDKINSIMGNISVSVSSDQSNKNSNASSASWGSVYWQYFEDLDKITFAETPLKLSKKLFIEKNTDNGPVLQPINDGDKISIGNKITVRIELRVDRDMEYVHMKDMRASCMEPVNVLSAYKYQDGLGYYETTKDVSTNFFFGYLNKGTYVFEYSMFVTHAGKFSNGITTIQCMYAPEFTAHSEGVRVSVE